MSATAEVRDFRVIDAVVRELNLADRRPLRDCAVLAVQHVHSSMLSLLAGLRCAGADSADIVVVGKSYSTRIPALDAISATGVNVVDPMMMTDPLRSYEQELAWQVRSAMMALRERMGPTRSLLVIDEGAVATKILCQDHDLVHRVHVVEQTTRGARWAESAHLPFPVVDVARSAAKADLEGPLVGRSMVAGIMAVLTVLTPQPRRLGVVGYGRMGARLARLLSTDFEVMVHDVDERNVSAARDDGLMTRTRDEILAKADLLLGCTGSPIVDDATISQIDRPLVLVNGASSDIEFALWSYRRAEAMLPGSGGDPARPWLNHYAVASAREHILVAGGFPINFHLPGEPIAPRDFEVTRALMLAGAAQTLALKRPGLVALDTAIQRTVTAAYERDAGPFGARS